MFDVFRRKLIVLRKSEGNFIDGYWQDGSESSFEILSSAQKADVEILDTLPEGYRTRKSYVLFTDTELLTAATEKHTPDVVIIDSERFIVVKIMGWQHLEPTKHYEVVVVKENADEV